MTAAPVTDAAAFVRANTIPASPPLTPELTLHLATEVTPLWEATEATLARANLPPPYWAFAWPGGQALARYMLDNPGLVAGRTVLDFAAGSGIVGLACARAGAATVLACDIDPFAVAAMKLNAAANRLALETTSEDLVGRPMGGVDIVLAGDVCYERPMAERVTGWLRGLAKAGKTVIMGDPGRAYLPAEGLEAVADYIVPTPLDLEDSDRRHTRLWRVLM